MSKNTNKRAKSMKKDEPAMNTAMKIFLAGCVAELYLLIVRRYYVQGNALTQIAWYDTYLKLFIALGVAAFLAGAVFAYSFRTQKGRCEIGCIIASAGLFLAVSSGLVLWNMTTITFLSVVVPVAMLLGILWELYDRECAISLTVLGVSLIAMWVYRRGMYSTSVGTAVKAAAVLYLVVLVAIAILLKQGKLGKLLPSSADPLPVYVACGLSVAALVIALVSRTAAYYAMWALAIVVFGLAVYYTVKQL